MPEQAQEAAQERIVRNLLEALERLHADLDRVEMWTAALGSFQEPAPDYQSRDHYLLPSPDRRNSTGSER